MNPHPHTSLATFVVYILVAIIFAVGGYFIGKGTVNNQNASIYKVDMTNNGGDSGIIVRKWGSLSFRCEIFREEGGVSTRLGYSSAGEKDCHALPPQNNKEINYGTTVSTPEQGSATTLQWVSDVGCVDFIWITSANNYRGGLVGFVTNIGKKDCKNLKPLNADPVPASTVTPYSTRQ